MKKFLISIFCISLIFISCNKKPSYETFEQNFFASISDTTNTAAQPSIIATKEVIIEDVGIPSADERAKTLKTVDISKVDYDLTKMSSTMIYSEVFNMMIDPDAYKNKIIKMKGNFSVMLAHGTTKRYFSVVVPDATACCQQGIEFVWPGEHSYPHDYPAIGAEITVTGQFVEAFTEGEVSYNYLIINSIE